MNRKKNVDLICSIGELAGLFEKSTSLSDFLQTVVSVVAYHMQAAVCSIYLFDDEKQELVLAANQGLNPDSIGNVHLRLGEGLTGIAVKELRPLCEGQALDNPQFKFFPGIYEEQYSSFLAVPILRGLSRVGALVVQDPQRDYFDENDVKALQAIAAQLATTIENAKLLMKFHELEQEVELKADIAPEKFFKGIPGSRGFAWGRAEIFGRGEVHFFEHDAECRSMGEFQQALTKTEQQLKELQSQMEEKLADVASMIFSAHLLILRDLEFSGAMMKKIENGISPQAAIASVVNHYVQLFSKSKNVKLQEKTQDVKDLGHRLLTNLLGHDQSMGDYAGQIVIAESLLPSDIVKLAAQSAAGLVLVGTSLHSHVSILARSLGFPVVILNDRAIFEVRSGTHILIDAAQGTVVIDPSDDIREKYDALKQAQLSSKGQREPVAPETFTRDGQKVRLLANINLTSELRLANELEAEGVGLYRSEFPFIVRNDFPSEEEQLRIYRRILEEMDGKEVVFRTLDIGGDKMLSYYTTVNEANPFLGLRAIRFSLRNKHIFSEQLKAFLRAGEGYNLKIMFPLVSSVDDFMSAKNIVEECSAELLAAGISHNRNPELGIMIELPSAVEIVEDLAEEADFLCIGTNDLIQYYLAVDRTNKDIEDLYVSHHPAVLRALKKVIDAGNKYDTPVSLCGDMGGDERLIPFLLGIGIRTLSIAPDWIPRTQMRIAQLDMNDAKDMAQRMLSMRRIDEISEYLETSV